MRGYQVRAARIRPLKRLGLRCGSRQCVIERGKRIQKQISFRVFDVEVVFLTEILNKPQFKRFGEGKWFFFVRVRQKPSPVLHQRKNTREHEGVFRHEIR